jgi:hypothetical protein
LQVLPFSLLWQVPQLLKKLVYWLSLLGEEATGTLHTKPKGQAEASLTIPGILTLDEVSTVKPRFSFRMKRVSLYCLAYQQNHHSHAASHGMFRRDLYHLARLLHLLLRPKSARFLLQAIYGH